MEQAIRAFSLKLDDYAAEIEKILGDCKIFVTLQSENGLWLPETIPKSDYIQPARAFRPLPGKARRYNGTQAPPSNITI